MKYHSVHNLNHSIPLFYRHTVHLLKEMWRWVLRSFVWHLLVNLKINYLLKKLLKWANKKCKNFTIYTVVFFLKKKRKKNTWRYLFFFFQKRKKPGDIIILHLCIKYYDDMIYSSWDIECDRLKLVIVGHF